MLSDLMRDATVFIQSDLGKYAAAGVGLAGFVGIYYLGDYLYGDRDSEGEGAPETSD